MSGAFINEVRIVGAVIKMSKINIGFIYLAHFDDSTHYSGEHALWSMSERSEFNTLLNSLPSMCTFLPV